MPFRSVSSDTLWKLFSALHLDIRKLDSVASIQQEELMRNDWREVLEGRYIAFNVTRDHLSRAGCIRHKPFAAGFIELVFRDKTCNLKYAIYLYRTTWGIYWSACKNVSVRVYLLADHICEHCYLKRWKRKRIHWGYHLADLQGMDDSLILGSDTGINILFVALGWIHSLLENRLLPKYYFGVQSFHENAPYFF